MENVLLSPASTEDEVQHLRRELLSLEKKYKELYDNAPDMYASIDAQTGRLLHCNETLLAVTGYTREELIGQDFLCLYDNTTIEKAKQGFLTFKQYGMVGDTERKMQCKDGRTIYASLKASAIRDEKGNLIATHSVWRDITAYKTIETELRQAYIHMEEKVQERTQELQTREHLYRTLIESIPHIVWLASSRGDVTFINSAWTQVTGLPRETALQHGWERAIHPKDLDMLLGKYNDKNHHLTISGETRIRAKDGTYRTMSFIETPIFDLEGKPLYRVGINTDITQIKESEKRLRDHQADSLRREHQEELDRVSKLSMLGELASGLAHELNQPLTVISAYAQESVQRFQQPSPNVKELAKVTRKIQKQASRAADIVSRIRDFYSGGPLQKQPVNLNEHIYNVVSLLLDEPAKIKDLRCYLDPTLPTLSVDYVHIELVIRNIVNNAVHAMQLHNIKNPYISILSNAANGYVTVTISNKGPTLAPELIDSIFEHFFSTKSDGMGLGLAMSRSVIEAHHGQLIAFNDEKATYFEFTLPIDQH